MRGPPPPDPRGPPMMRPGFERPPGPGKLVHISRRYFLLVYNIIRWDNKNKFPYLSTKSCVILFFTGFKVSMRRRDRTLVKSA